LFKREEGLKRESRAVSAVKHRRNDEDDRRRVSFLFFFSFYYPFLRLLLLAGITVFIPDDVTSE
jgi:hypothetical protein